MDSSAEERLKQLQIADLGTARREYVTTVNSQRKDLERVRLEDVEASRLSNVAGTNAQQLAERNKSKLSAWSNAYQNLGDVEDLERLDNLLNGQTHRMQLSAAVRGVAGKDNPKPERKVSNASQTTAAAAATPRAPQSLGRGGGVAGTRGRGTTTQVGKTTKGAVSKLGNHAVESPNKRTSGLDPALDPERHEKPKHDRRKPPQTILRTRRVAPMPTGNYSLCSPDDFLAVSRGLLTNTKRPSEGPSSAATADSPTSPPREYPTQDTVEEDKTAVTKSVDPAPSNQQPERTTAHASTGDLKAIPTKLTSEPASAAREYIPDPHAPASKSTETEGRSDKTASSDEDALEVRTSNGARRKSFLQSLASNLPHPIQTREEDIVEGHEEDKTETEQVGTLLDFDDPQPEDFKSENPTPAKEQALLKSPVFEDLEGIDFFAQNETVSSLPSPLQPEHATSFEQVQDNQEGAIDEPKNPNVTEATVDAEASKYQEEISMIGNLMKTMSLSRELTRHLEECKMELNLKLHSVKQQPTAGRDDINLEQQSKHAAESKEVLQPASTSNTESESVKVDAAVEVSRTNGKLSDVASIEKPVEKQGRMKSSSISTTTVSPSGGQLQKAVNAPPFVPRSASFTKYRSPTQSIQTESSSPSSHLRVPDSPTPRRTAQGQQQDEYLGSVFAEHPLPGGHPRQVSSSKQDKPLPTTHVSGGNNEDRPLPDKHAPQALPPKQDRSLSSARTSSSTARGRLLSDEHASNFDTPPSSEHTSDTIFGDHLLPGRRGSRASSHQREQEPPPLAQSSEGPKPIPTAPRSMLFEARRPFSGGFGKTNFCSDAQRKPNTSRPSSSAESDKETSTTPTSPRRDISTLTLPARPVGTSSNAARPLQQPTPTGPGRDMSTLTLNPGPTKPAGTSSNAPRPLQQPTPTGPGRDISTLTLNPGPTEPTPTSPRRDMSTLTLNPGPTEPTPTSPRRDMSTLTLNPGPTEPTPTSPGRDMSTLTLNPGPTEPTPTSPGRDMSTLTLNPGPTKPVGTSSNAPRPLQQPTSTGPGRDMSTLTLNHGAAKPVGTTSNAPRPLQQSIHAPKQPHESSDESSQRRPARPVQRGLQASRWATPEN